MYESLSEELRKDKELTLIAVKKEGSNI